MYTRLSPRVRTRNVMLKNNGEKCKITYFAPQHPNDLKRIGRELTIRLGRSEMVLNGTAIRSLSKVIQKLDNVRERKQEKYAWVENKGNRFGVTYTSPVDSNDLKREGQVLMIEQDNTAMKLDGASLRSLRSVLQKI